MKKIRFVEAKQKNDIETVVVLADTVWREHYRKLLSPEQIDYMLDKFQNFAAIKRSIDEGERYFIVEYEGMPVGYFAFVQEGRKMYLDKLYIVKERRGERLGVNSIGFVVGEARKLACNCVYLTVNKNNTASIKAYRSYGFETEAAVVTDIGGGFVMDDFRMYMFI